jgi:uncharacterized membrane protein required for colicin V production
MSDQPPEHWNNVFFIAAAILILLLTIRGWKMGVVRQVVQILALIGAYVCAWIGGPELAPYLKSLSMPNAVLVAIAGSLIGLTVFFVVSVTSAILFKKTKDQSVGVIRLGYGAAGAFVGMIFGVFIVWAGVLAVKVLGTIAQSETKMLQERAAAQGVTQKGRRPQELGSFVHGLADMKQALERGPAGPVVEQVDPVPGAVYRVIQKIGAMLGNDQSLERFMNYPGVKPLADHPRIRALQNDPAIVKHVTERDILALMRNPHIVQAANDTEIMRLMRRFEFEKALDYALGKPEKPVVAPNDR